MNKQNNFSDYQAYVKNNVKCNNMIINMHNEKISTIKINLKEIHTKLSGLIQDFDLISNSNVFFKNKKKQYRNMAIIATVFGSIFAYGYDFTYLSMFVALSVPSILSTIAYFVDTHKTRGKIRNIDLGFTHHGIIELNSKKSNLNNELDYYLSRVRSLSEENKKIKEEYDSLLKTVGEIGKEHYELSSTEKNDDRSYTK